jgi:FtsP/CotA-like multicopper oxidase with cupredoxin domain
VELVAGPVPGRPGALGYNGASPGPILRGLELNLMTVRLVNRLGQATSLRLPTEGSPQIPAGATRGFTFLVLRPGFDLYGPFEPAATGAAWNAGLFGAVVTQESSPPPVDLDAVVIFSGDDPQILRANADLAPLKLAAPPGGRVRLRLANAAPDFLMNFRGSDATANIVAIDGSPCELFSPRGGEFALAPGARFELMFDLDVPFDLALVGATDRAALQILPSGPPAAKRPPIAALPAPDSPSLPREISLESASQLRIVVSGAAASGYKLNEESAPEKPLFRSRRGTPVTLTLVNRTPEPQTFRLEAHVARILHALDDGWDPYWRDTLFLPEGESLHVAFLANEFGKWSLASTSATKRAKGMMGWYEVS